MIQWRGVRWLTVGDLARELGRHPRTVHDWIKQGRLPSRMIMGIRHVAETELDKLFQSEPKVKPMRAAKVERELAKRGY